MNRLLVSVLVAVALAGKSKPQASNKLATCKVKLQEGLSKIQEIKAKAEALKAKVEAVKKRIESLPYYSYVVKGAKGAVAHWGSAGFPATDENIESKTVFNHILGKTGKEEQINTIKNYLEIDIEGKAFVEIDYEVEKLTEVEKPDADPKLKRRVISYLAQTMVVKSVEVSLSGDVYRARLTIGDSFEKFGNRPHDMIATVRQACSGIGGLKTSCNYAVERVALGDDPLPEPTGNPWTAIDHVPQAKTAFICGDSLRLNMDDHSQFIEVTAAADCPEREGHIPYFMAREIIKKLPLAVTSFKSQDFCRATNNFIEARIGGDFPAFVNIYIAVPRKCTKILPAMMVTVTGEMHYQEHKALRFFEIENSTAKCKIDVACLTCMEAESQLHGFYNPCNEFDKPEDQKKDDEQEEEDKDLNPVCECCACDCKPEQAPEGLKVCKVDKVQSHHGDNFISLKVGGGVAAGAPVLQNILQGVLGAIMQAVKVAAVV